ncbi:ABC transporter ATP-binding protein [Spirochaeta isovalerica]|uniref:Peptide/nickel transport system ATP-binding protein n=1 Tax=Spirochaeta isovalerica TaxID=150 RepID=A0A841RE03_9SPIO|nr:oligopeptide/dipeptide ABC transporter ATP-binding protein [Spirochaeta isovalerica]MBB6481611.1 peptide/nickel transport system ATP-binding protein [Spirochaeta isovalerica]
MDKETVFSVQNVTMDFQISGKTFFSKKRTLRALNDVSFDLYKGESLAVVGESGCGKSTLCRIAMRFYKPTSGQMIYHDGSVHSFKGEALRTYRQKVQMIFQDPFSSLNPLHSIYYHLKRPLQLYHKLKGKELKEKMDEALEMVGLVPPEEQGRKNPHQLSGGQKQRAFLARIMAIGADIIFADEPTSMLDVSIRLGVLNLMNKLKREMGKSFLYITHDIATARYFSDRIIVLYSGHMVEWGDVDEVVKHPVHPYTKLLISAAPDPERETLAKLEVRDDVEKEVTMWTPESRGCPFRNRCPVAESRCADDFPEAVEVKPNQFVRCIHAKEWKTENNAASEKPERNQPVS